MNLRIVINQYPQCLESRAKLSAILRDLYPTERREINLILNVYECGIADKISHLHSIDAMQAQIFCRQLEVEYSLSTKAALLGLSLWLEAYQIPLQHNSPAPKHSNRLCPPEKVLAKKPSTLSLLPSHTTCTLDNGVQYELKILTLSTAEIIKYNSFSEKNVVIPSIIDGKKVVGIGKDSFRSHSEIEYVRISEGIRYVNDGAFAGCRNLKSFLIPQSLVRLGTEFGSDLENTGVFERTAIEHIILPGGIRYIGKRAFKNCYNLKDATILSDIECLPEEIFFKCVRLTIINFPVSLKIISTRAFAFCEHLQKVTLPKSTTSLGKMAFAGCISLHSIQLNDELVSIQQGAFQDCCALKEIHIPSSVSLLGDCLFDWISVTSFENYIYGRHNLLIYCALGSPALEYAQKNDIPFRIERKS